MSKPIRLKLEAEREAHAKTQEEVDFLKEKLASVEELTQSFQHMTRFEGGGMVCEDRVTGFCNNLTDVVEEARKRFLIGVKP